MLQSASDLLNFLVFGNDGYLGPVRDLYFEDSEWIFRYIVIEMAETEISSRHLISPLSIKEIRWDRKEIYVNLDFDKISSSPEIDINLPISRQNEVALRRYYEWPIYWGQSEFFDPPPLRGFEKPIIPFDNDRLAEEPPGLFGEDEDYDHLRQEPQDDEFVETEFGHSEEDVDYSSDLRNFLDISGYRLQTSDADSSFVTDLIFTTSDWIVKYLVVNLGNGHSGELILLTLHWVTEINWSKSRVYLSLTQAQLQNAPRLSSNQQINIDFERKTNKYYDSI
jgi:hypothetical protein